MTDIPFSSIDKQIEKLVSQNLIIEDTGYAKYILELFGYSNLIKSYREPYVIKTDTSIQYRSGVTFEQIHSLYMLDKNLRNSVMSAMQDLEEHIKETAASVVAETLVLMKKITWITETTEIKRNERKDLLYQVYLIH